jgi:secondary thiamine-phosphate synthase enzyme
MQTLSVKTNRRTQLVDVTAQVQKVVASSGVVTGICYLYVPHTTAAITINECTDPGVARDIEGVNRLFSHSCKMMSGYPRTRPRSGATA